MIKALIFDVGGVLLRTVDAELRLSWDRRLKLSSGTVEQMVFNSASGTSAQKGDIGEEEHWRWLAAELELSPDQSLDFRRDFWAGDEMDEELIAWIRRARSQYQTAIISNAMSGLRAALIETYRIGEAFDVITVSAEEGIMKPDAAIYERTLARLGRKPEETVFVDDFPRNVVGAQALNMNAIHFTSKPSLFQNMNELRVEVDRH